MTNQHLFYSIWLSALNFMVLPLVFHAEVNTRQYLQGNISPGQTAPPAEADLHVVKPTVSFGDVSDLYVAATL